MRRTTMAVKFRIINKSDNKIVTMASAEKVALWMLGKRTTNYIIVKTFDGDDFPVVIDIPSEYTQIVEKLKNA